MSQINPHPKSLPHNEGGTSNGRTFAVLAYIVPLIGGLIGLLIDRRNPLTRVHAQQSLGAVAALALSFVAWGVIAYLVALIPAVGPVIGVALFSFVIAMTIFLLINWIFSLLHALRGAERTIPFGNRIVRRVIGGAPDQGASD